jgi:hypothetical protein
LEAVEAVKEGEMLSPGIPLKKRGYITTKNWPGLIDVFFDLFVTMHFLAKSLVTSVTQKTVPSAVVYYYCAWYVFLCNRN